MLKLFKVNYRYIFIFLLLHTSSLDAYESENRLKTVIIGKIAKYISWNKEIPSTFSIAVLGNDFGMHFEEVYLKKKIKSKPVQIHYIETIYDMQESEILFISQTNTESLEKILAYTKHKNVLTISDKRGFAQKGGIIQLYFFAQRLKIRINISSMEEEGFKVDRTLLRIVDIVKKGQ